MQTYHLELVGRPESWATIDRSSVPLMPGDAGTATITFAVPPADQVPSGEIVWALRARAETDAADVALEEGTLIVEGETSLVCELLPATAAGRRRSRWAFTLGDNGRWGWVPQVFFSGGANDERDAGLHLCGAQGNTCSP